jgi:hypothetical protein
MKQFWLRSIELCWHFCREREREREIESFELFSGVCAFFIDISRFCVHVGIWQETEGDEEGEGEEEEEEEEAEDDVDEAEAETDASTNMNNAPAKSETSLPVVFREPERQLSKKELKKKELAELDAVLAELGLVQKEENGNFVFSLLLKHLSPPC